MTRRFIPLRPLTRCGGQFVAASDTVVYVNMDHVVRVTMRGSLALVTMRDGHIVRVSRVDFMKQVERLHES